MATYEGKWLTSEFHVKDLEKFEVGSEGFNYLIACKLKILKDKIEEIEAGIL